jgi:hypothetical protein
MAFKKKKTIARSQAEAAVILGIAPRTFANWLAQGCPVKCNVGYDIGKAREWDKARKGADKTDFSELTERSRVDSGVYSEVPLGELNEQGRIIMRPDADAQDNEAINDSRR